MQIITLPHNSANSLLVDLKVITFEIVLAVCVCVRVCALGLADFMMVGFVKL